MGNHMNTKLRNSKGFSLLCFLLFIGFGWVDSPLAATPCPSVIPAGTVFNNPSTDNCDGSAMTVLGTLNNYGVITNIGMVRGTLNNYGRVDAEALPITAPAGSVINQQGGIINRLVPDLTYCF
jgi:hypothetical protein